MADGDQGHFIFGYRGLSVFLTEHGFPITKSALNRLGAQHRGPPVHGSWSNAYTFHPADVLAWARERAQQPRSLRGRGKSRAKIVAAPVQIANADPPMQVAVMTPAPPPTINGER
jgi:hypothetical protein